jgi:hypothetical protein
MTTVEIARARLAQVAARRATPKRRTATTSPRHDDSDAQSALEARQPLASVEDRRANALGLHKAPLSRHQGGASAPLTQGRRRVASTQ